MKVAEHWATTRGGRIVAGILCVMLAVWLGGKMRHTVRASASEGSDYEGLLSGARAVLRGEDVVTARAGSAEAPGRPFWYLPWFAMVMVPFELMGHAIGSFVWPLLNLAALGASSYWCLKVVRGPEAPVPWAVCVVPPLLVARALDSNFGLAQVNVLLLALVSLGVYLETRRRNVAAGIVLGVATALKVTPGLLVAYYAWKRKWRVAASAVVVVLVLAVVVPAPVYGLRGSFDSAAHWLDAHVLARGREVSEDGYVPGQSLKALCHRLLTPSQAAAHTKRRIEVNVASLPEWTAEVVYLTIAGALLLALLAVSTLAQVQQFRLFLAIVAAVLGRLGRYSAL